MFQIPNPKTVFIERKLVFRGPSAGDRSDETFGNMHFHIMGKGMSVGKYAVHRDGASTIPSS